MYIGSLDRLYAIDIPSGSVLWTYSTNFSIDSTPAIGYNGWIYFGSLDDKVYALNSSGGVEWTYLTGSSIYSSPAIGVDGTVYISSDDGYLYALNGTTGALKWRLGEGTGVNYSSPTLGYDGTIYVGSSNSTVYAVSPAGTILWTYVAGGAIDSSITLGPSGLYFGCEDGYIYSLA